MTRTELITKGVDLKYTYRCPWISIHTQPYKVAAAFNVVRDDLGLMKLDLNEICNDFKRKMHSLGHSQADHSRDIDLFKMQVDGWTVEEVQTFYHMGVKNRPFRYPFFIATKPIDGTNLTSVSIAVLTRWK